MNAEAWTHHAELKFHHFFDRKPEFVFTDSQFDEWVMVAPEAGRFEYELDDESGEAGFGDVVCVAPQGKFLRHVITPSMTYHVLRWKPPTPGKDVLSSLWSPGKWMAVDTVRLTSDYAVLRRLQYQIDPFSQLRSEMIALDILHLLWESRYLMPKVADPLMQKAAEMIRERARDMISMQEISNAVGLGQVRFTRRFREVHGVNPVEYLTKQRLILAQDLLINTNATIDEIAGQCGWSHGSYLSRIFVEHFGLTPGEFRRQRRV